MHTTAAHSAQKIKLQSPSDSYVPTYTSSANRSCLNPRHKKSYPSPQLKHINFQNSTTHQRNLIYADRPRGGVNVKFCRCFLISIRCLRQPSNNNINYPQYPRISRWDRAWFILISYVSPRIRLSAMAAAARIASKGYNPSDDVVMV